MSRWPRPWRIRIALRHRQSRLLGIGNIFRFNNLTKDEQSKRFNSFYGIMCVNSFFLRLQVCQKAFLGKIIEDQLTSIPSTASSGSKGLFWQNNRRSPKSHPYRRHACTAGSCSTMAFVSVGSCSTMMAVSTLSLLRLAQWTTLLPPSEIPFRCPSFFRRLLPRPPPTRRL